MLNRADPHEVQRQVELAYLLEATIPKPGCTSRYRDVGPKQRFEDFLVSAVNSGKYFHRLAERIAKEQKQPEVIYDLAYEAMMASRKDREGKIVNYGLIESMVPVVTAACLFGKSGRATLGKVAEVLKGTSREDVRYVARMRHEIYSRSNKKFKRDFPVTARGRNVLEHYQDHAKRAHQASRLFVSELMDGMPLTAVIYDFLRRPGLLLAKNVRSGFVRARQMSALPSGALADFTAVALFLYLANRSR